MLRTHSEMERAAEAVDVDRLFTFVLGTDKGSIIQNGAFLATCEEALQRVKTAPDRRADHSSDAG